MIWAIKKPAKVPIDKNIFRLMVKYKIATNKAYLRTYPKNIKKTFLLAIKISICFLIKKKFIVPIVVPKIMPKLTSFLMKKAASSATKQII